MMSCSMSMISEPSYNMYVQNTVHAGPLAIFVGCFIFVTYALMSPKHETKIHANIYSYYATTDAPNATQSSTHAH